MNLSPDFARLDLIEAPVFVLEVNDIGLPVYVAFNAFARRISGRPLSDYLGRPANEIYPERFGETAFRRHCEAIDTGRAITYELELPLGGRLRRISTTLRPEKDAQGVVFRLYGTSRDITAEEEARNARMDHQTAASEMEQFVAMAAHDLRAPMRNVVMLTEMLLEDFTDHGDGKLELIEMIEELADKTMELIRDVLAHAQTVEVGGEETTFELAHLACTICEVLDPKALHAISVTPVTLHGDRTPLQVALRNLMENAIKHAGQSRVAIDISARPGREGLIEFTFEDNGKGFSEAAIKMMNGGTFRMDGGYGLFGVRRMIRARGGELSAGNSTDTGGALIRFSLPGHVLGSDLLEADGASAEARRA